MRVLIVEDSAVVRKVVQTKLRQSGLVVDQVVEADNGQQGLELLRAAETSGEHYNLILCDINMPVLDGLEFLEHLRAEALAATALIVMITTEFKEASVMRALASGVAGYITKPFTGEQLRACVQPLIALDVARNADLTT